MVKRLLTDTVRNWFEKPAGPVYDLVELQQQKQYPVLTANELFDLLGQQQRLLSIRRLLALPDDLYEELALRPLQAMAELVQLSPASAAHHHSTLGGLIVHQLEVIEHTLKLRKQYRLPQHASTEDISVQDSIWTYGFFAAALCHDTAKSGANIVLVTKSAASSAFTKSLVETGAGTYSFKWLDSPLRLHEQIGPVLLGKLLPAKALGWLMEYPGVFENVVNTVFDSRRTEGGVISTVLREADGYSVSRNLLGQHNQVRPVSGRISVIEKIQDAIRYLVSEREITWNRPGASAFSADGYAYLIPKTVLDLVISYMRQDLGDLSFPSDRERLMDIMQEHGYVIANQDKAITHIEVIADGGKWKQVFTALKVPLSEVAKDVPELKGSVQEVEVGADSSGQKKTGAATAAQKADTGAVSSSSKKAETKELEEHGAESTGQENNAATQSVKSESNNTSTDDDLLMIPPSMREDAAEPKPAENATGQKVKTGADIPVEHVAEQEKPETEAQKAEDAADLEPTEAEYQQIADKFVEWIEMIIEQDDETINTPKALVHRIDKGLFIVSPKAFKEYAGEDEDSWTPVQRGITNSNHFNGPPKKAVTSLYTNHNGKIGGPINGICINVPKKLQNVTTNPILKQVDLK